MLRDVQIDKFFYKGLAFLVLVLVGAFDGVAVLAWLELIQS